MEGRLFRVSIRERVIVAYADWLLSFVNPMPQPTAGQNASNEIEGLPGNQFYAVSADMHNVF